MIFFASAVFIVGYIIITLEHYWKVNKSVTATALAAILWAVIALSGADHHLVEEAIHHLSGETFFFDCLPFGCDDFSGDSSPLSLL